MEIDTKIFDYVSRETLPKYEIYFNELQKWNKALSLVQKNTINDFWFRHVLDSLQIIPNLDDAHSIIDMGSGAGFPGMVLAISGIKNITLCESNTKKCLFLSEIARLTDTKVTILNKRIEEIQDQKYDLIISRACTSLLQLLEYGTIVSRETESRYLFHKGAKYLEEIEEAQKKWNFNWLKIDSITSKDGVILDIRNVNKLLK